MKRNILSTPEEVGEAAAALGAETIRKAAAEKDELTIVLATGASQFAMLARLTQYPDLPWSRIQAFHLDEYIGLTANHPASFRRYLIERFVSKVDNLGAFYPVHGDVGPPTEEIARLNSLIADREIDVCFAGIGENGHLAFNDPPADFETREPYILVDLDEACRRQQCNEGWFEACEDVPAQAISMSVAQLMKSKTLVLSVPGANKAQAVKNTFAEDISPQFPSTKLRDHPDCHIFLDAASAKLL